MIPMAADGAKRIREILLVEDNVGEVRLMEEILKENSIHHNLHSVRNGQEALAFLRREEGYTNAPRPDLILLDLNLPKMEGRRLLKTLKEDPLLRRIPVMVLTASENPEDILHSYDLHANGYLIKPTDLEQFSQAMRAVIHFWFEVAALSGER